MEIYLDANATTPVLPQARAAAWSAMADGYGNPSSIHGTGLRARAVLDATRHAARRVLGIDSGQVVFTSGATEGIQTAVLSALSEIGRRIGALGDGCVELLYGASEHKAVPEAIRHWNKVLGLDLPVHEIPVGTDGRHDLDWLRAHAARAGLVCTMAANNETGVVSDLDGIAAALEGSHAFWMVDSVQALGKLALRLHDLPIDYAPFSGHKLYAPKGIGLLYVRKGAPFTPLLAGGGQEGTLRAGTENMAGIAALGAVLKALEDRNTFADEAVLVAHRSALETALRAAFPGIVFNAPGEICLATTLNFSVPGLGSKLMLDLFEAADLRVSGGSACSAAKAQPSHVLEAMGLPEWQVDSAVRMSFGPATDAETIAEACRRIRACGESLRASCLVASPQNAAEPPDRITRFTVDGACCYLVADAASSCCVIIDPLSELTQKIAHWVSCRRLTPIAVLDTHSHGDHESSAGELRAALKLAEGPEGDALGWPVRAGTLRLGSMHLNRLSIPGHTRDSTAYLLNDSRRTLAAFVGDTVLPGALGRSDFEQSDPLAFSATLRRLLDALGPDTLMLPGHDYDNHFACTLRVERTHQRLLALALDTAVDAFRFAALKDEMERNIAPTAFQTMACGARVECSAAEANPEIGMQEALALAAGKSGLVIVDVREPYEQRLGRLPALGVAVRTQTVPLSGLVNALPHWLDLPADACLLFVCRSGNRSTLAARALKRLGHEHAWSLRGGLALWQLPNPTGSPGSAMAMRAQDRP